MFNAQFTNTIFKSKSLSFEKKEEDYRYVKAINKINKGELLLIEHVYSSSKLEQLSNVILNSPELFNNLYPRKMNWDEEFIHNQTEEVNDICNEKTQKNCFGVDENCYAIGLEISNFNHSITPNASVKYTDCDVEQEVPCFILYMYAHNIINPEEEITISYGNAYFNENIKKIKCDFEIDNTYINNIVYQYIRKNICKNIILNHICIFYGLYFVNDMICLTKRLQDYFTETLKKECHKKNIIIWLNEKKEKLDAYYLSL